MAAPRTQRQKQVLDYIIRFLERRGYTPSYAQIANHLGVKSRATVHKHIKALVRLKLISIRDENGMFRITVMADSAPEVAPTPVPVLPFPELLCEVRYEGRIAAGQPIEVVEDDMTIAMPRFMLGNLRPEKAYALKIVGDSMIDDHICDGDIALIEQRTEAHDGEIVVALIDETHATLKRLFRHGSEIELRPANSDHAPLRIPAGQVRIQGIFRGLIRSSH
jgi:repressor LexA